MRARFFLRLILIVIPTIGLMLLWLSFLPRQGQAAPLPPASAPAELAASIQQEPTPIPTPDPRWMEIVRLQGLREGDVPSAALPTINLNLTDVYVAGRVPYPSTVEIALKYQGEVLAIWDASPVPDGSSFIYWVSLSLEPGELQQGYELWVTQGAATISMTVPTLTGLAYPQTEVLSGTAPASAGLLAYLFPYADPEQVYTATATAGSDGAYQIPWAPAVDLVPRDMGYLFYAQDPARLACIRFVAPFLSLQVGGSDLFGMSAPGNQVDIVVEDETGANAFNFSAYSAKDGSFNAGSCTVSDPVYGFVFAPGQRVIVTAAGQVFSMTVFTLSAHADRQAGQVSGQAPASQPVEVLRFAGPLTAYAQCFWQELHPLNRQTVTATAGGAYTVDLPLAAGNYGTVQVATADGYQEVARYAVSYVHVRLGTPVEYYYTWERMWGSVDEPFAPITVEVQGPSGYLKDWYTLIAQDTGYFVDNFDYGSTLILDTGDRITLTTPHSPLISLLLPVLTAEADPYTDIVSGQAPPGSQVVVSSDAGMQLTVTVDAEGGYSADFSDLGGFYTYAQGDVTWTSPEGYEVTRNFQAWFDGGHDCPPHFGSAQIGGTGLYLVGDYMCGQITFRLRSADGQVKYEHVYPGNPVYINLFDENGRPVLITTGDQIELEGGGGVIPPTQTPFLDPAPMGTLADRGHPDGVGNPSVETVVVPTLTVNLNPQTDQVSGQTLPFAEVSIEGDIQPSYWSTTANAQGTYLFDLAGVVDLDAGSGVHVTLHTSPSFYTYRVIPVMNTFLYTHQVYGSLQPFTPYTITLSSPITVSAPITGYASGSGMFPNGPYPPPVGIHGDPGDRVTMETPGRLWELILPFLSAHVDATAGLVSGQAPPNSQLAVNLIINYQQSIKTVITATASGTYATTFAIPPGPLYISGSIIHFTAFDMRTYLFFAAPHWYVTLGSGRIYGAAPVYGEPITVTLQSYDGAFSQVLTTNLRQNDFNLDFQRLIQPGDRLAMYTSTGLASEFTVPYLSAVHDFARRVLEGYAPPGGELIAFIPGGNWGATRHIRQKTDGSFGVDTSDLELVVGSTGGYVQYSDRLGNTVVRGFTIRGFPGYLPLIRLLAPFP